jgi:hypothetical protein
LALCAVHGHPPGAETRIETAPPAAAASTEDGDTSKRHGAASCAISTFCCSTVTLPRRLAAFGLAWTEKLMVADPCPCPPVREIHGDSDRADQAHSRSTVTVNVPVPPPAGIGEPPPATVTPQRLMDDGATLVVEEVPPHPWSARSSPMAGNAADHRDEGEE